MNDLLLDQIRAAAQRALVRSSRTGANDFAQAASARAGLRIILDLLAEHAADEEHRLNSYAEERERDESTAPW